MTDLAAFGIVPWLPESDAMSASEPLTLTIPPDFAAALREAVSAGEYGSVEDALADALTVWACREEDREDDLAWIKAKIRASIADPRPSLTAAKVRAHLKKVSARSQTDDDVAA